MESRIREIFPHGILNPGLCNPESSSRDQESANDWNPDSISTDKESGIRYLEHGIQELESGIYIVETRIQDCLGLPNMWRKVKASQVTVAYLWLPPSPSNADHNRPAPVYLSSW